MSTTKNTRKYIFHLTLLAYFFLVMFNQHWGDAIFDGQPLFIIPKSETEAESLLSFYHDIYGDVAVSLFSLLHSIVNCLKSDEQFSNNVWFHKFRSTFSLQ